MTTPQAHRLPTCDLGKTNPNLNYRICLHQQDNALIRALPDAPNQEALTRGVRSARPGTAYMQSSYPQQRNTIHHFTAATDDHKLAHMINTATTARARQPISAYLPGN